MVKDPRTKKDKKPLGRYGKDQFKRDHPCSYEIVDLNKVGDTGTPVYKVIKYIVNSDHLNRYSPHAIEEARKEQEIGDHDYRIAKHLYNLDVEVTGRGTDMDSAARPKDDLNSLWLELTSKRDSGADSYQLLIYSISRKLTTLTTEDAKQIIEGDTQDEENDEEESEEREFIEDSEDAESNDDKIIIKTRDIWGSDDDFVVWMYAKMIGRDDIAEQIAAGGDPTSLRVHSNLRVLLDESSNQDMLARRIQNSDTVQLTPEQDAKFDQARQIFSTYADTDKGIVQLVDQMSRLEIIDADNTSGSDGAKVIDPGVEDDNPIPDDYDFDPSDSPQDVPSALQAEMEN